MKRPAELDWEPLPPTKRSAAAAAAAHLGFPPPCHGRCTRMHVCGVRLNHPSTARQALTTIAAAPSRMLWYIHTQTHRATMQAAADACVPLLDAATAAQQLAATQELLARIAEQQRQQQRVLVVPQAEGEGVEVAFSYQQQQQPQQQTSGKKVGGALLFSCIVSCLSLLTTNKLPQHSTLSLGLWCSMSNICCCRCCCCSTERIPCCGAGADEPAQAAQTHLRAGAA